MRESKTKERGLAIRRGLEFIYRVASDPQHFADYGSDLISCFYFISKTSEDAALRRAARALGRERARRWRHEHPGLPREVDAEVIVDFVHGSYAAERLGLRDDALHKQIRRAAARFTAEDYLWFDPESESPPVDVPEACECGAFNPRGRKVCRRCRKRLKMMSRYWIYLDALMRSYTGERYKVRLGASFASVIKWLPALRPYDVGVGAADPEFYEKVYAITHVVYTLNDYSLYQLSPRWLPEEYEYLLLAHPRAVEADDPETLGEIMDTLRAFGLTARHRLIREGIEYLLTKQNADGSWGDTAAENIYQRYHPTWTAIDGLREYKWRGQRLSFPKLLPFLRRGKGVKRTGKG